MELNELFIGKQVGFKYFKVFLKYSLKGLGFF
jgi:hypothetical protein